MLTITGKTHDGILSAIISLAGFEPLSVTVPFRGCDVVSLDGYDITAYKVGKAKPIMVVKWEDITPVEALLLKRACRYTLERNLLEANERLSALRTLQELFEKSPFGC